MRIEVAFEAYASAKLHGQRKYHDVRLPCTTWVEVEEVPPGPAVLRMTRPDGGTLEFRSHGERLMRPFEMTHGSRTRRSGPSMPADRLAEVALTGTGPFNPFVLGLGTRLRDGKGPDYWERRPLLDAGQIGLAHVEGSDEDTCRAIVGRNAAKLACVEGAIWERSAEPLYVVGHVSYEDHQADRLTAWVEIDDGGGIKEIGRHFRVDDLVDVLTAVLPSGEWDPEDPTTFAGRFRNVVEVLDASVLRHGYDQYPALARSLRWTVESVGRDLAALPTPAIHLWTRTRDLLSERSPGQDLAEAASRLAGALDGAGETDPAASIRQAVDLWRLSPVAETQPHAIGPRPCS